jgi:hypothetical protein
MSNGSNVAKADFRNSNTGPASSSVAGKALSIFISYPSENQRIAQAIEAALRQFDRSKFDVFLDRSRINDGAGLRDTIVEALKRADYFIGIGPEANRVNFSWCGFELGYFLASNSGRNKNVLAVYNNEIPDQFHEFKNVQVVSLENKHRSELGSQVYAANQCDLFHFFSGLSEEIGRRFPPGELAQYFTEAQAWAEKSAKEVTEAYFSTLQEWVKSTWFPQKRIEVRTGNVPFWEKELPRIPDQATVILEPTTCRVLDYAVSQQEANVSLSWMEFQSIVRRKTGGLVFTSMIEEVITSALPDNAEALNDHFFSAPDQKNYRILLVMHKLYGNGNREFVINLVETLRPIVGEGDRNTTIIAAAIMLASKYRFLFLEQESRYGANRVAQLTAGNSTYAVRQMLKDMDRVHAEGTKEGLGDQTALIKLFGPAEEFEVHALFEQFWPPMIAMKDAAAAYLEKPDEATRQDFVQKHKAFVDSTQAVNARFISMCLARYQNLIETAPLRAA